MDFDCLFALYEVLKLEGLLCSNCDSITAEGNLGEN
jgi:hypothetical protein